MSRQWWEQEPGEEPAGKPPAGPPPAPKPRLSPEEWRKIRGASLAGVPARLREEIEARRERRLAEKPKEPEAGPAPEPPVINSAADVMAAAKGVFRPMPALSDTEQADISSQERRAQR